MTVDLSRLRLENSTYRKQVQVGNTRTM